MATAYDARVWVSTDDTSEARRQAIAASVADHVVEGDKNPVRDHGDGRLIVRIGYSAEDASEVEIQATALVASALRDAGLTTDVASVENVEVRTSS